MRISILFLALLLVPGCTRQLYLPLAPGGPPGSVEPSPDLLTTRITVEPQAFRPGETAHIEVSVTNRGTGPLDLRFSYACQLGYRVDDTDGIVVGGYPSVCGAMVTTLHLEPGENHAVSFLWRGEGFGGFTGWSGFLPAGTYTLVGGLLLDGFRHPSPPVTVELLAP